MTMNVLYRLTAATPHRREWDCSPLRLLFVFVEHSQQGEKKAPSGEGALSVHTVEEKIRLGLKA